MGKDFSKHDPENNDKFISEKIILRKDLDKELTPIVRTFLKLMLQGIKDKKLDWKQQLKGLGIAKASFNGILKSMGEDIFIDSCIPILKRNISSNLEKGIIQSIEFYQDKDHYAELVNVSGGYYKLKVFKKGKDYKVKRNASIVENSKEFSNKVKK